MTDQRKAYLYAFAVVAIWSTVSSAFKLSLRYVNPLQLLFIASLYSTAFLFILVLAQRKWRLFAAQTARDLLRSCILGLLNPFLYYIVLFKAYDLLRAQEAQALNQTWAIVLPLLSIVILKQKIRLLSFIALALSFAGVLLISSQGNIAGWQFHNLPGIFLALGSAWIWALYWLFSLKDSRDTTIKLFSSFLFGTLFIVLAATLSKQPLPGVAGIVGGCYVGMFEMGLTFVLWLHALRLSRSTAQISNLVYLVPFLALIVIRLTTGEQILVSTIIGLALIIIGIVLQRSISRH
ncbi:DMT family transporter [candidate division WOR-3 bacterium]|nr:DMT family transporter [candidate division WOR-3 bacterium]